MPLKNKLEAHPTMDGSECRVVSSMIVNLAPNSHYQRVEVAYASEIHIPMTTTTPNILEINKKERERRGKNKNVRQNKLKL